MVLREITKRGFVSNQWIGENYSPVNKFTQPDEFEKFTNNLIERWEEKPSEDRGIRNFDDYFGFVIYSGGSGYTLLHNNSTYYIMNPNGGTFEPLRPH
jgi:hypothetical protein